MNIKGVEKPTCCLECPFFINQACFFHETEWISYLHATEGTRPDCPIEGEDDGFDRQDH